jgi:hypothetical protein
VLPQGTRVWGCRQAGIPGRRGNEDVRYGLLADAVVGFHFLWILFLVLGAWWGRSHRLVRMVHLAALILAFLVETLDWFCPLTHLELWLRHRGSLGGYSESFIAHYLNQLIYLDVSHTLIVILTILLCMLNLWWYLPRRKG